MAGIKEIFGSVKMQGDIPAFYIYGDITSSPYDSWGENEDVCPAFVRDFIDRYKGKEVHIHINSPGGNVFSGVAIYNMLKAREGKTIVYIDGLAASAASVIALAGDTVYMPKGSMMMIHEPWVLCAGNSSELRAQADSLDKICESITAIYQDCSGAEIDDIVDMLRAETWLTAEEAMDLFGNVTVDEGRQACACARGDSLKWYDKIPKALTFDDGTQGQGDTTNLIEIAEAEDMNREINELIAKVEIDEMLVKK
jgi:ATP-dependent Clp protease protease subunit